MLSQWDPRPIKSSGQSVEHNNVTNKKYWPTQTNKFRMENRMHVLKNRAENQLGRIFLEKKN